MQLIPLLSTRAKYANRSKSGIYQDIANELFVPPVKVGRSSAWPVHEVDAIIAARVAGKSDDEIRALVKSLVVARTAAA